MPIPVFYSTSMLADASKYGSPSPRKPAQVVESWSKKFPIQIIEPTPVTVDELARAHDRQFVKDILACKTQNGFDNTDPDIAKSLPYTSGAMLRAARHALKSGRVAVAPCSGFHHAEYAKAMGFCTFNGLMVTALALRAQGLVNRVGILDLDMHYGNGTDNILDRMPAGWCRHYTGGAHFRSPHQAPEFFHTWLPIALSYLVECDLVLYQAGADPHINDPHGGWLTTDELRMRDAFVFDSLSASGVPVAWNLAGGYQVEPDGSIPKVLEIHDNTMAECVRVYG